MSKSNEQRLRDIENCLNQYETHLLEIAKHIQAIEQLLKERLPKLASKDET